MRKKIVLVCVAAVLLVLAGLRLFGFIGVESGATGVQGDSVRFSTTPLGIKLLKGEPDSVAPHGDTPSVRWRYEDQVAFGRSCSIEYTIYHDSTNYIFPLLLDGMTGVAVEIPVEDGEDGNELFDRIYAGMQRVYSRERGFTAEEAGPWVSALRWEFLGSDIGPPFLSAGIELREDCVFFFADSEW